MRFSARRWQAPENDGTDRGPIPTDASWGEIFMHFVLPWLGGKLFSVSKIIDYG